MGELFETLFSAIDRGLAACLLPLGVWILVNGIDDAVLDAVCLVRWLAGRVRPLHPPLPSDIDLLRKREKRIAIFVPLWNEHHVIADMLERNTRAIEYGNYEFFVGCYPNDPLTIAAVEGAAARSARIQLAVCPNDGPTSKADCLNWLYQRMARREQERGMRYDVIVIHDAEDVIHPASLRRINFHSDEYDMVQIPVLPLATPLRQFTHGLYCDEFAEYQSKDIPARRALGGFLPSNGVGTGYSRRALEKLASLSGGRVFDPTCLTEDYEIGLRLHLLGYRQFFVPIQLRDRQPMATREYFPASPGQAVKQRTRWVTGICLQGWERNGWRTGWKQWYWLWRDRKGLIANALGFSANLLFLAGLVSLGYGRMAGSRGYLQQAAEQPGLLLLLGANLAFQLLRLAVRAGCVTRIYGWNFALGVPVRILWGNWINFLATVLAISRYAAARLKGESLAWHKTEHAYPEADARTPRRPLLEEVLVEEGYVSSADVEQAMSSGAGRLGEWLVSARKLSAEQLCDALARQNRLPVVTLDSGEVPKLAARALPAHVVSAWKVLPFRITDGKLFLAGPEPPNDAMMGELQKHTRLEIRFHLITAARFEELRQELL